VTTTRTTHQIADRLEPRSLRLCRRADSLHCTE
jgi:hypothetical protein